MKFDCVYEGIKFNISVEKDESTPISHINQYALEDVEELDKGQIFFYSIFINTSRDEQTQTHYLANQLLTSDKTELAQELDELMEDEDIFAKIIQKWVLVDNESKPPAWSIDIK